MTESIKARWLTDNEQVKIAPKTLVTQILNEDGTRFKKTFEDSVNNINTSIDETNRTIRDHTNDTEIHVTAEEKEAWSNIEVPSLEGYATEEYVESMVKSLNSNLALSFYCVEDVTIITNGVSETFPANSNVELKFLDTDVFEIVPTSNNSILSLTSFPGALGTFYPWLEGVRQFSNILFDMNNEDMYTKWSQGQQGMYEVQSAQYLNCIFWSDNPYISDVTKRTNYTLTHTSQLPLCYSSIPDNTFKSFYLADGVVSDPNWGNQAYLDSFAKATWATQVFSYYGARTIGRPELFVITLPKDCRGLMFYARNVENAGIFDATNVTNFGAKSGSWREAFGYCSSLRRLYISNLKVNLNISWSPVDYESIYYIISEAANTNAITISVSPYTYYLLRDADFNLAASKNITIALLTTNYKEDKRFSTVAYTTGDAEFTGDVIAGGNGGSSPVSLKSVNNLVQSKVDKEEGKGLSTNDFTTEEKEKLAGIETGANKITITTSSWANLDTTVMSSSAVTRALEESVANWETRYEGTRGYIKNKPFYEFEDEIRIFVPDDYWDSEGDGYIDLSSAEAISTANGETLYYVPLDDFGISTFFDIVYNNPELYTANYEMQAIIRDGLSYGWELVPYIKTVDNVKSIYFGDASCLPDILIADAPVTNCPYAMQLKCDNGTYTGIFYTKDNSTVYENIILHLTYTKLKKLDNKFLNVDSTLSISGAPADAAAVGVYVDTKVANLVNQPKTSFILTDIVNGNDYVIQMKNGNLITFPVAVSIDLISMPSKTTYLAGETVNLGGMILAATSQDGSLREITDYTYEPSVITKDTTEIVVTYIERGITYTYNIPISVDTTVPDPI